jgi:hypothetical protein
MPRKVSDAVLDNGHFLGDYAEQRTSRAAKEDILSVFEAWLLATETYGRDAQELIRDHLKQSSGFWG